MKIISHITHAEPETVIWVGAFLIAFIITVFMICTIDDKTDAQLNDTHSIELAGHL